MNRFSLVHRCRKCIVCVKGSLILYEQHNKVLTMQHDHMYIGGSMYISVSGIVVYA